MKRLIAAFLAALTLSTPVFAADDGYILDEQTMSRYSSNGIYYYNPKGVTTCPQYAGEIVVYGETAEEKIWTGLNSFLTPEQAAGAMGNMAHESNYFNPVQHEISQLEKYQPGFDLAANSDVAYGIGLIQWSFGRRTKMINYVKSKDASLMTYFEDYDTYSIGYTIDGNKFLELVDDNIMNSLISIELEFLRDEIKSSSTYSGFLDTTTVEDAATYFLEKIEVPNSPTISAHPERLTDAQKYYDELNGKTISAGLNSNCGDNDVARLQSLVLKYAWPEYHAPSYTELMPDYAAIVKTRQAQGKYVGGIAHKGVDCGGWVTTLMQESGWAEDYNDKNGDTSGQEAWVKSHGWQLLNANEQTEVNTSLLQPGDVAFSSNHTFVFVGDIDGFDSQVASASLDERAPMAGHESLTFGNGSIVRWYRKP